MMNDKNFHQKLFCAIDYDNDNKKAIKARNDWIKQKKSEGYQTEGHKLPHSLITKGGIGTGQPQIDTWTTCYIGNAFKRTIH